MSTLSIEKSQNLESTAPKKGGAKSNAPSRRKVTVRCGHRQESRRGLL